MLKISKKYFVESAFCSNRSQLFRLVKDIHSLYSQSAHFTSSFYIAAIFLMALCSFCIQITIGTAVVFPLLIITFIAQLMIWIKICAKDIIAMIMITMWILKFKEFQILKGVFKVIVKSCSLSKHHT